MSHMLSSRVLGMELSALYIDISLCRCFRWPVLSVLMGATHVLLWENSSSLTLLMSR